MDQTAHRGEHEKMGDGINHLTYVRHENGIRFGIRVQPKSSRIAIAGIWEGRLKLSLTAPPADNAANKQCIAYLARIFDKKKEEVTILAGLKSRSKTVYVSGLDAGLFHTTLKKLFQKDKKS